MVLCNWWWDVPVCHIHTYYVLVINNVTGLVPQELGGNATLIFYGTEEAKEGKNAYMERRRPDFSKFPRKP